jgi:hypothetical protein
MLSSCHVQRRLRTLDGNQKVRPLDLSTTINLFIVRYSQVSSSLVLRTQSMTAIPPTLILKSLSLVYRFSESAMAYRCVDCRISDEPLIIAFWTRINWDCSGNRVEPRGHSCKVRPPRIRLCTRANQQVWERAIVRRCPVRRAG